MQLGSAKASFMHLEGQLKSDIEVFLLDLI